MPLLGLDGSHYRFPLSVLSQPRTGIGRERKARAEVNYAAEFFRGCSEDAVHGDWRTRHRRGGANTLLTHVPMGVAALIAPWKFARLWQQGRSPLRWPPDTHSC